MRSDKNIIGYWWRCQNYLPKSEEGIPIALHVRAHKNIIIGGCVNFTEEKRKNR
jgi:hypothetical protein